MKSSILLLGLLAAGSVSANECVIELVGDDMMKFDKTEVTVSAACPEITINLRHSGKLPAQAMGHNVVISPTPVYTAVAQEGMKAGLAADYVPAGDARVIAHTKVIGGGETISTTFPGSALKAGEAYTFFCSFPGHWAIMKGNVVVTP